MKILVVEDDKKINSFITKGLEENGCLVESVFDGSEALDFLRHDKSIDLMILDLMLPKVSGMDVLNTIRSEGNSVPVIILTAKRTVDDKISGLQAGADDYLEKPFSFMELYARVQAILRRNRPVAPISSLSHFGITMDLISRKVTRENMPIDLQAKEFSLLEYLMKNPGKVITKTMILENVYGHNFDTQTNIVDVLVFRLRSKIDKDFPKKTIQTVRGVGYVFKED